MGCGECSKSLNPINRGRDVVGPIEGHYYAFDKMIDRPENWQWCAGIVVQRGWRQLTDWWFNPRPRHIFVVIVRSLTH